jgi:hypothetical protein
MEYLYKKIKSMRQLFNIDESEKQRILEMHENAIKKHYLIEQSSTSYEFSTESVPARQFIYKEFNLFKSNPNFATMTPQQQIDDLNAAREKLKTTDMNALVKRAQEAGVTSGSTTALQTDLQRVSGNANLKFVGTDGTEKAFVDGKLGTNTVDALLRYQIYLLGLPQSTKPVTNQSYVQPGSAKVVGQGTYNVGKK